MIPTSPCTTRSLPCARAGVGLKPQHFRTILDTSPEVGFFEIHAENYMGAGGPPHRYLAAIRERYPLSVHGVGQSIGADRPLARDHLQRLKAVVDRYQPLLVSEHLAWSTHDAGFLNDLLPLPYTRQTLARVVHHVDEVQEALGRQILLENPSTYLAFAESTWSEPDFIAEVATRSGCALLLDVNNVLVASTNQRWDPVAYLDAYPMAHVRQIHLAGHLREVDERGGELLIDTHDRPVARNVWDLYRRVIGRIGAVPTLIEWDAEVPAWPTLMVEAQRADAILSDAAASRHEPSPPARASYPPPVPAAAREAPRAGAGGDHASQAAFVQALLDTRHPVPSNLVDPEGQPSPRRFGIYRNNVVAGLIGTLKDAYPVVARIVGDEFFTAMARAFVTRQLPVSPVMLDYGAGFAAFVGAFEPATRSVPYLRDVARLERAWLEAYHAPEASALPAGVLASHEPTSLMQQRVGLHPSLRVVRSHFPVLTLWRTNVAEATPTWVDLEADGQCVLVSRSGADVELRTLLPGTAVFVEALREDRSLLESMELARSVDERFDLGANLVSLLEAGALVGLHGTPAGSVR